MLHIVKIEQNSNGSHDDQMGVGIAVTDGWAIVPENMQIPETYPFVDIETAEIIETTTNEAGESVQVPTGVYVVTSMTAGVAPEPVAPEPVSPAQEREQAYNTEKLIEWDGQMLTVTQASQKWQYYAAEGSTRADELQALIASAKADIRAQYPDSEGV